jgi:hypothetical protein
METVRHGGTFVNFEEMTSQVEYEHCVLCSKPIMMNQKIYRVEAGNMLFPIALVHKSCTNPHPPFDKNHPLVWTAAQLHNSWKEAQKYKHWFD